MKPYYKRGGFFDRLDRFSRWFDYHYDEYGILYFIPVFRKFSIFNYEIKRARMCRDYFSMCRADTYAYIYNREKYWWMGSK